MPPPLPPPDVLGKVVDCCRPELSVGPSAATEMGGGSVPPSLARTSWSALSLGSVLGVRFLFPFLIWRSRSIGRSVNPTVVGINSQSIGLLVLSRY